MREQWTPIEDAQILLLRCNCIHPYDIADMLSMQRNRVEDRLAYLKKQMGYTYPRLRPKANKWSTEEVDEWRSWINTGRTQRERSSIIREIARLNKTSYEVIYNRLYLK